MKYIFIFFASLVVIASCSKEKSYDPAVNTDTSGLAIFDFKAIDSTIYTTQVGTFVDGFVYDSTAYFTVPIIVNKLGKYSIDAYAIYGLDTLFLSNSGTLSITDDHINLYPSNITSFTSGSNSTVDSTLNKITLNDSSTVAHPFVVNFTVN